MNRQELKNILESIKSEEDLISLVCEKWGFEYYEREIPLDVFSEKISERILYAKEIAKAPGDQYRVILLTVKSDINSKSEKKNASAIIRSVHKSLSESVKNALFILANKDFQSLMFAQVRSFDKTIKIQKFIINFPDFYWTPLEQLAKLDININPENALSNLDSCFDVDAVSEEFFLSYRKIFETFKNAVNSQINNESDAHDFTQQLFGRLMFIYFLQKKGWLDNNKDFFNSFWEIYRKTQNQGTNFYDNFVKVLFFDSLSKEKGSYISESQAPKIPKELRAKLQMFPYLNGGLFKENPKLDNLGIKLPDKLFEDLIDDLLERYNFTIDEESPLDIELAIDPSMLGMVYESLVNSEERGKVGIFYTDKVELDMMCRLSLTKYLIKNTGINHENLYKWIFQEEESEAQVYFSLEETDTLTTILQNIKIVDPACGSGGYLISFLNILFELLVDLKQRKNQRPESYQLKKQIIEHSLYGADVKSWAVEIARLRMWLNLIIEADDTILDPGLEPLLPSLDFKIRTGDSLVQKIGDIHIAPEESQKQLQGSGQIKKQITELINLKQDFYYNRQRAGRRVTNHDVYHKEKNIFWFIIETQIKHLRDQISHKHSQGSLGFSEPKIIQQSIEDVDKEAARQKITELSQLLDNLKKFTEEKAFWPISFAEVFDSEEKGGFDIVIANPPYVRQESIAPPDVTKPTPEQKKQYKKELNEVAELWFPNWFDKHKLSGRSDLYVFFYLLGLKLLNNNGVFCYISENSWLDVGYGTNLQDYLLNNVPMQMIIDNQVKRSFKSASVNTIVAIFDPPQKRKPLENVVKFINFKKEFEAINNSNTFIEIENKTQPSPNRPEQAEKYRLFNLTQEKLLENGQEPVDKNSSIKTTGKYIGDKWGGKYLRAPDIYWTILEKGKDKLVRLGDIAEVRRGFTTGANEFFYLQDVTDELEEE
ncbi:MAG: Eco57I restriction-modification methylase [Ignavibacteria bacterium ADurb.Bin266]|nr:MAG: Eco57I restriction-modification methylase [Ignavibacteria bacterium ADurb.Bin266]